VRFLPCHPTWLIAACCLLLPAEVLGDPRWISVSFVDADTSTRAGISWADEAEGGDIVQWGLTAGALDRTTLATRAEVPDIGLFRNAVLDDLRPDTKIFYRVGGPQGWSGINSFWTGPVDFCEPVRFAVLGDGRGARDGVSPIFREVLSRALEDDPAFVLDTGDLVREGREGEDWVKWLDATDGLLGGVFHMPTVGNHDDGPGRGARANFNRVFQVPRNGTMQAEDLYFFTYGPVAVAVLNSALFGTEPGNDEARKQAAWLELMLGRHPRPWRVVVLHHPLRTSRGVLGIGHPPDEHGQNAALLPVLDRLEVDLVFQGHVHWYERFLPSRPADAPAPSETDETPFRGTVHITTGGAGAPTMRCWLVLSPAEGSQVCADTNHYTLVEIDRERVRIRARAAGPEGGDRILDDISWTKALPHGTVCEPKAPNPPPAPGGAP